LTSFTPLQAQQGDIYLGFVDKKSGEQHGTPWNFLELLQGLVHTHLLLSHSNRLW
jgi:hypothetical protein